MTNKIRPVGTDNEPSRIAWVEHSLRSLPAGWRILDAGAGQQLYRAACEHLNYVAQDFAQYDPQADAAGLQQPQWDYGQLEIVSDIAAIPEPDGAFDAVLCSEVLEHVPDPLAALRELARLLRTDGQLILTAPFISLTHFAPYHFSTGFNRYFYQTHLPACGLRIDQITANGNFFELLAQELRRLPAVAQRYSHDRLRLFEKLALRPLLAALSRFSRGDNGSAELACFSLHVRATKVGDASSSSTSHPAGGT